MQRPEAMLDVTLHLWSQLASELVSIIGEGGFQALYSRSLHLTAKTFPWVAPGLPSHEIDSRFASLKTNLEEQDSKEAGEASIALLGIFIDILGSLIGELLTTSILRSAWGDDALDSAVQEPQQ
jgi:hypothetical protein